MNEMNANVLLIIHDNYQSDNQFPLGPAYIASALRNNGAKVTVYCQDVFHYSNEHLSHFLYKNKFDIIGLGFASARFRETVYPLTQVINDYKKDAWFILGGHGPSPIPEYMLWKTRSDIIALGESDETIIDLLHCRQDYGDLADVESIAYRVDNEIYVNKRRKPPKNLDSLPFPAWEYFPMDIYSKCMVLPGQDTTELSLGMITTRGCVGKCAFCMRLEEGIRLRSIDNIMQEMNILYHKFNIRYFNFQDELFVFNKKRLFEFRDSLIRNNMKIKFFANARVDLFDREMALCLKEIGCKKVNFGFESMDQTVLDTLGKRTKVSQNEQVASTCKEIDLNMGLNILWGLPKDNEETLQKDIDFINKYNTYGELRTFKPPTPYPGCPLYYQAITEGKLADPEDFFFNKFKNLDMITVNFTELPEQKMYELLYKANKEMITNYAKQKNLSDQERDLMIKAYYKVYFEGDTSFKGARHFARKEMEKNK